MGKEIPWSFQGIRGGEQLNLKSRAFTNVASLTAAGITPAKHPGAVLYLSTGGTGSVPCLVISDGTNWKQIAVGANAI
jgi:hypothetical protein